MRHFSHLEKLHADFSQIGGRLDTVECENTRKKRFLSHVYSF